MSAPTISIFIPAGHAPELLFEKLKKSLSLIDDHLPPRSAYDSSAQLRDSTGYRLIQFQYDSQDEIIEMLEWETPSPHFKAILAKCTLQLHIHYRCVHFAKQCIMITADHLGKASQSSIVENGHGCLLILSGHVEHLSKDPSWSWERVTFPEIPEVADSEWIVEDD